MTDALEGKPIHKKGMMVTVENWTQYKNSEESWEHQFTYELDRRNKAKLKKIIKQMFKEDQNRKKAYLKKWGFTT